MAEEYKLPYSGADIYRRLRDVDAKANVAQMTYAEFEALSPDEVNANTLYSITDLDDNDEYYTQVQVDEKIENIYDSLDEKADANHSHDDLYDAKGSSALALDSAKEYTDEKVKDLPSELVVDNKISNHNELTSAHSDIRELISNITNGATKVAEAANADSANTADYADTAAVATQATQDGNGKVISSTYETKIDAGAKLEEAKAYADGIASVKADAEHNHDGAYDVKGSANTALDSAKDYTDDKIKNLTSATVVDNKISAHNTSTSAHNDIRDLITELTNRLNAIANSDDTTLDQMAEIVAYIKNNKTLIDSVTTSKINVSDIVDNLTTSNASKVLSAKQGVALKALIDDLQVAVDEKVSTSRTINGKALSADITLSASDVGADPIGSASAALESAKTDSSNKDVVILSAAQKYTDDAINGIPTATTSANGLMSSSDKTKLKNITGDDTNLTTSILEYAQQVDTGIHNVHLGGMAYTGNDLPHINCIYGTATIVKRNATTITVYLNAAGMSSADSGLYCNVFNGNTWTGWTTDITSANIADYALPVTGGTISGNIAVDGYSKTGNCYNLPPVYMHNNGILINLGDGYDKMTTLVITGNAYTAAHPINSVFQFYSGSNTDIFREYCGVHYGADFGNVTVYRYDGNIYAWFIGTTISDYCTFNVQVISNKSLGDINISNSAAHTEADGATFVTTIIPTGLKSTLDSKLSLSGGTINGNLAVDGTTRANTRYKLPTAYHYANGVLVEISHDRYNMVTLVITGNTYASWLKPINSIVQFYDYSDTDGIIQPSGVHYGADLGNITVYRHNGKLYAHFNQPNMFSTIAVEIIANREDLTPSISNSAMHESGRTAEIVITPTVAQLTDTVYTLPVAGSAIGGIKSGGDITVASDGTVSVNDDSHNHTIANVDGLQGELNSKASTAVATVVSNGLMSADDKNKLIRHTHATFGGYDSGGYLKIKINSDYQWMLSFVLRVYSSYRAVDIQISGYNYGYNNWYSQRARTISDTHPDDNVEVAFGYDDDGLLWIATPAGNYTAAGIFNAVNGFDTIPANEWENLFTITREETLSGTVQSTSNSTMLVSSSSVGLMSAADKVRLDSVTANVNGLTTSILDYANQVDVGIHNVHLSGGAYTGGDLPHPNCMYGTATIVKRNATTITVYLSAVGGSTSDSGLYYNMGNGSSWYGWVDLNKDTNTTYTLSKSGSDIVLTGSDGSMSSVTDTAGSGSGSSGTNRTNSGALSVSSYPLPDARFYLVTVHLDDGSGSSTLNETFALDWYGLYDAWQNKGSATFASAGRIYMNHTNTSTITTTEGYITLKITAYNTSTQRFTIATGTSSELSDYDATIVRVCSYS